jgi:chemotaxis protein methyltransferase CheR
LSDFGSGLKKDLTAEEFGRFRDWIHKHSGIYLEETKLDSLRISLVTRATRFGFVDYREYYHMLTTSEDEFKELMNLITINETSFFRFPAQFEVLRDMVIPEILDNKALTSRSFRVWSAGCSTGEEPYTIAMSLLDSAIPGCGYRPEVLGTDVSTSALDRAKEAVYGARAFANLEQSIVQRWFEPVKGGHRPHERVRDIVDFSYHNLVKEPYPLALLSNWDVIFCRNVTIYFRMESTRRVVNNFYDSLNPGGYLFIGHSETLTTISDRFEVLELGGVFLYRKPAPPRLHVFGRAATQTQPRLTAAEKAKKIRSASTASRMEPARPPRTARPAEQVPPPVEAEPAPSAETVAGAIADAQALLEQGRPLDAKAAAERALAIQPNSVDAMLVRAYSNADSGDFEAAVADASAALAINPLLAPARYILGIIYQRQGETQAALGEFKRTIYIDPEFVLAHFNAANIYRVRGSLDDACREYENTLRSLYSNPTGDWTVFLGGFRPDLLAKTCERSLIECRRGS